MKVNPALGRCGAVPLDLHPAWYQLSYFCRALGMDLFAHADRETLTVAIAGDWRDSLMKTLAIGGHDRRNTGPALLALQAARLLTVGTSEITIHLAPFGEIPLEQTGNPMGTQLEPIGFPLGSHSVSKPSQVPEIIQNPTSVLVRSSLSNSPEENLNSRARAEFLRSSIVEDSNPRARGLVRVGARSDRGATPDTWYMPGSTEERLRLGFAKRSGLKGLFPNELKLAQMVEELSGQIEQMATLQTVGTQVLIDRILDGFFADDFARGSGYQPKLLASTAERYALGVSTGPYRVLNGGAE